MSNTPEQKEPEWLDNKFNYAASDTEIMTIQERVVARSKNKDFTAGIMKGIVDSGVVPEDCHGSALALSLYMNTAYEVGKAAGLADLATLVDKTIDDSLQENKKNG